MTARPLAISVESVSKDFRLASEQRHTLKERVINPRFDRDAKQFHALRDVSFEVERGEFFGIVGRNGSGKSTLLKCLAGIYQTDGGRIRIGGRLSTFIELGVGFNPDLAARDNVILNGIMLGLSPKEAAARVDQVIEFAELQDHVDLKLKNYSSGMQVRLAFSVLTQVDADVLLIDEVLAVGDASFQAKCFDVFRELRAAGKTIVLVTHDMPTVARFCDRALLLNDGELVMLGDPVTVGDAYLSLNFDRPLTPTATPDDGSPFEVVGAVSSADGEQIEQIRTGATFGVVLDVTARRDAQLPEITIELVDELDQVAFATSTRRVRDDQAGGDGVPQLAAGERWRMRVWADALLRQGQYRVRAVLRDPRTGGVIERTRDLTHVEVTSTEPVLGLANLPHEVTWAPVDASPARATALRPNGTTATEHAPTA